MSKYFPELGEVNIKSLKFIKMFIVYHAGVPILLSIISTINNFSTYLFSARSSNFQNKNLAGAFMMKNILNLI